MISSAAKILVFVTVTAACFGCDRASKILARENLQGRPPRVLLRNTIVLAYDENQGAMLSIGSGLPARTRFWLFIVGIGTLLFLLALFIYFRGRSVVEVGCGALAVGGGLGNLFDRLKYDGSVIDFVSVGVGPLRTAVFNFADVTILVGVLVYLVTILRTGSRPPASTGEPPSGPTN